MPLSRTSRLFGCLAAGWIFASGAMRSMTAGDVAVIPGNVEHEGVFRKDTEVVDFFAPPREDFLARVLRLISARRNPASY